LIASRDSLRFAVRNVALWGDTDVLPFPLENHWFYDDAETIVELLSVLDGDFDEWAAAYPPISERALSSVGYVGFRSATQIDAIWNAYLLALVVEIGWDIENARLAKSTDQVFSYRFAPDTATGSMFDRAIGWSAFQRHALKKANDYAVVLSADISDFYARVYHHRIENSLRRTTGNAEAVNRIKHVLKAISVGGVSYGLPIGGNASRLLAELLLDRTDRLLRSREIPFCRFVDDYYIFASSTEEARRHLVYLSEVLQKHEGLALQRGKTRLMTRGEFARTSPVRADASTEAEQELQVVQFLRLRLMYDPYSPTAEDDYDRLREELQKFDILGMLGRELRKSRVDEVLVRQLTKSIRFLDPAVRGAAVESLTSNLDVLYPLFPTVVLVIKELLPDLSASVREVVFGSIRNLVSSGSHILLVPAHLSFAIRLMVHDPSDEADVLLAALYKRQDAQMMLRRDLILCLARRRVDYWVADVLRQFTTLSPWEKRALIAASYVLGDEGEHWRKQTRKTLHRVDQAFMSWVGSKNDGRLWEIPM
jgi:reverse transcriptase-like protein